MPQNAGEKLNRRQLAEQRRKLEEEQRLDKDALMNYFPMEAVVKNTISIYEDLLGLSIRQIDCTSVWAADITCWKTYDAASGELLGQFYLDLVPREGKLEFPTTYTLQKRSGIKPDVKKAVVAIVAQLGRPVEIQVEGWEKSLLPFDEVTALFKDLLLATWRKDAVERKEPTTGHLQCHIINDMHSWKISFADFLAIQRADPAKDTNLTLHILDSVVDPAPTE